MSLTDGWGDKLFGKNNVQKFIIYTMDYKYSTNPKSNDKNIAIEFDSLISFKFSNKVDVNYEPLEDGEFSTDTLHDNPFFINVVASKSYLLDGVKLKTRADGVKLMQKTLAQLDKYLANGIFLTIIPNNVLIKTYQNLKLIDYQNPTDINTPYLKIPMVFQQIRITQLNGGIQNANNETNNNISDGGNVQPQDASNPIA